MQLISSLDKTTLSIPASIRDVCFPMLLVMVRPESFATQTGLTFDPFAAHTLSDAVLGMILHPERASRLSQQAVFDPNQLSLKESLDNLIKAAFKTTNRDQESKVSQQIVQGNLLQHLMRLGADENVSHLVRGEVHEQLNGLDDG